MFMLTLRRVKRLPLETRGDVFTPLLPSLLALAAPHPPVPAFPAPFLYTPDDSPRPSMTRRYRSLIPCTSITYPAFLAIMTLEYCVMNWRALEGRNERIKQTEKDTNPGKE
ncbi:hypothetical protein BOTBODRAFT_34325 [Botryobasidium botryosum FD-172 SS1]|uniref:Uncharacterized protein n=1 Tax=Botryobasidium botryosum (strain FD-172 SS1) TaxID=930990 RepID=A0A067M9Z7_BOTB1|nr:hypothetical protein BOTBODRAFT_34325 [Botryobasidium botryosum FD-172 SS1]